MRIFIFLLSCMMVFHLEAQESHKWNLERWTIKEGLPNNVVKCIFKDNDGFLWIATAQGLSRFDGIHFINFLQYGINPFDTVPVSGAINEIIQDDSD